MSLTSRVYCSDQIAVSSVGSISSSETFTVSPDGRTDPVSTTAAPSSRATSRGGRPRYWRAADRPITFSPGVCPRRVVRSSARPSAKKVWLGSASNGMTAITGAGGGPSVRRHSRCIGPRFVPRRRAERGEHEHAAIQPAPNRRRPGSAGTATPQPPDVAAHVEDRADRPQLRRHASPPTRSADRGSSPAPWRRSRRAPAAAPC